MVITLTLALPRDQLSVPVVRRILSDNLFTLGLDDGTVGDIQLALTEACTNVLDHAGGQEEYEVSARIDKERCVIEIIDRGIGFNGEGPARSLWAEDGRGVEIMRTVMDRLEFVESEVQGTVVHLEKLLTWDESAVLSRLARPETA